MPRSPPSVFRNFSVRLDFLSDERRRRLERVYHESAPRLLERLFREFEKSFLTKLSDTERAAYFDGNLEAPREAGQRHGALSTTSPEVCAEG
jgi:hypothetical protein